jgi:hypothetical protein
MNAQSSHRGLLVASVIAGAALVVGTGAVVGLGVDRVGTW